jgi:hypothetical protein
MTREHHPLGHDPVCAIEGRDEATASLTRRSARSAEPGGCIEWTGARDANGYGRMLVYTPTGKRTTGAHRVAWILQRGEIPPGLVIDHVTCRNHGCVNVEHMEPVSHFVNSIERRRMVKMATLRIDLDLWDAAKVVAAKQGVTVSDLVRQALQAMVDGIPEQRGPRG